MNAVRARGLQKSYGSVQALRGIDFEVARGEVFAFLGPNGAGKTTTVEILEGYRRADNGEVSVLGFDPAHAGTELRDRVGIVLQQSGIERELAVREFLTRMSRIYSRPADPDELIDMVGLTDKANARIKTLSGGQRRRLDLAASLIGSPDLVFLDEPTTGFDPGARRDAWQIIRELSSGGTTVILTTHYLDEAQQLADRVAVIASGAIVAEGDPDTLAGRDVAEARIKFRVPEVKHDIPSVATDQTNENGWTTIRTSQPTRVLAEITGWAVDAGVELEGLEVLRPTLEDTYLSLVDRA